MSSSKNSFARKHILEGSPPRWGSGGTPVSLGGTDSEGEERFSDSVTIEETGTFDVWVGTNDISEDTEEPVKDQSYRFVLNGHLSEDTETGTVTGSVTDSDNDPLPNVAVEAVQANTNETESDVSTDADGTYTMEVEAGRTYELVVEEEGFEPYYTDVTVEVDGLHTESIMLESTSAETGDGPSVEDYTNATGRVEPDDVEEAFADWQAGEIDGGLLADVFAAWQSGEVVA